MGGHVTEADDQDRYASTVCLEHIRLQIFLLALNKCKIVGGDIGSAYLNAFTKEKIWSILGIEFGENMKDRVVQVVKALYGLKTSANAWFLHLSESLSNLGFKQSKIDSALWYKPRADGSGYDYFTHHVDDFLITGIIVKKFIKDLKKSYTITGNESHPFIHLGMDIKQFKPHFY